MRGEGARTDTHLSRLVLSSIRPLHNAALSSPPSFALESACC